VLVINLATAVPNFVDICSNVDVIVSQQYNKTYGLSFWIMV